MVIVRCTRASVIAAAVFLLSACGGGGIGSPILPASANLSVGGSSTTSKTVVASSAPTSVPGSVSVSASLPVSATVPAGSLVSWSNGAQIPAWFLNGDFGASGPLYQQLSAAPQLDPNSANEVSYYFAGNAPEFEAGWIDANKSQAQYDYNFPVYVASASDPLVTIFCNNVSPAPCSDGGVQIHMPALARQAGGEDHHLAVLEATGTEYDFWLVSSNPPYRNGSRFSASGESHYSTAGGGSGANYVAPGFDVGSATAGGIALSDGQIYTSELSAGVINHAISLTFPCSTNAWVYPASQATGTCANGQGMPLGSRVWWQPTDAQTNMMSISHDMTTVLIALHHYGGFFTDNGSGSVNINGQGGGMGSRVENQEAYWLYGNGSDPALAHAANSPDWLHITGASGLNRYLLTVLGSSADFLDNLKVIAPCVTRQTC
jgi:hypothetical protein